MKTEEKEVELKISIRQQKKNLQRCCFFAANVVVDDDDSKRIWDIYETLHTEKYNVMMEDDNKRYLL